MVDKNVYIEETLGDDREKTKRLNRNLGMTLNSSVVS